MSQSLSQEERDRLVTLVKEGARTVTVPLRFPVEHLGKPVNALTMRRISVGDVLDCNIEKGDTLLLARITDTSPETIRSLDLSDYDAVTDVLAAFRA